MKQGVAQYKNIKYTLTIKVSKIRNGTNYSRMDRVEFAIGFKKLEGIWSA